MKKLSSFLTLLFIVGTLPLLSSCGKSTKALGPAESMQALIDGVSNQKMEAVWNFLPASYQTDVNGLVKDFAGKMDAEMYHGSFQVAQRITKLLKDKKEFILENETITGIPVPPEKMGQFWDPTVNVLDSIVQSDLSNLDKLKNFDGGKFLSTTGNKLAQNIIAISDLIPAPKDGVSVSDKLKQAKVSLVSEKGDTATIKIEVPGETPKEDQMVKVEGKWIPKSLADNWKSQMAKARKQIDNLTPEKVTAQKKQTLDGLKQMNDVLAQLEKAENSEEFNKTLDPIIAPAKMILPLLMMQFAGQAMMNGIESPGGAPSLGDAKPVDPNTIISIVVPKKLSSTEQNPIVEEILKISDGTEVIPMVAGETTIFQVSPVKDVKDFASKIKFGKTTNVDPQKRSITVELK